MDGVYFKGLNGIRAIACSIVLICHIDQFLPLFGIKDLGYHNTGMACYGVILFFVLSGYLITYLMLQEKNNYRQVDIVKFYKRRVLRIWPIYYLVILIAIILINANVIVMSRLEYNTVIMNYSLFGSNIAYAFGLGIITLVPLWSVSVEEQFYSFWPLVINSSNNILKSLVKITVIYLLIKIFLRYFENGPLYSLVWHSAFDSMAAGGIFAYLVFSGNQIIRVFYHPLIQIGAWLFLFISILYKPIHFSTLLDNEMHSIIYAILIVNLSTNPKSLLNLENRLFNFIGKISYGIYVFHMTIVVLLSYFLKDVIHIIKNPVLQYMIVYVLVIAFTLIASHISYKYFESFFLKIKFRFSPSSTANTW